jgi:NADH-quinone oxidoreductase subunit K
MPHQELFDVGLRHFLVLSAILFSLGAFTVVTRKNAVGMLMGVELVLNAANINLVAFNHYILGPDSVGGQVFALFVIVIAAAEAAIALAIVLSIYQNFGTIDASQVDTMKN